MAQDYDSLILGGYYTEDYLKRSGHIQNSRSVGTLYDLVLYPEKTSADSDVRSSDNPPLFRNPSDDSYVFRVVEKGRGTQDVAIQDQSSAIVDRFLTRALGVVEVAVDIPFGARSITLQEGHGFTNPPATIVPSTPTEMIELSYAGKQYQSRVYSVVGNVIGVTNPICIAIPAGTVGARTSPDGNVLGTNANPVIMSTSPPAGVEWDINIMSVNMLDQSAMDDAKFGGIDAPINGVVYRTVNDVMAENIFTAVDNSCFIRHCDVENPYSDKAPSGFYGFNTKRRFNGQQGDGVSRRIGGDYHSFQAISYADLTGLDRFWNVIRGHVVDYGIYND